MNIVPLADTTVTVNRVARSKEWEKLVAAVRRAQTVWFIGNGGLYAVAQHAADDITRLTGKACVSLDSACMITSIANDCGFENLFHDWLAHADRTGQFGPYDVVIGLSCSGSSKNVCYALNQRSNAFMISGKESIGGYTNICLDTEYYHETEVIALALGYQLVYSLGYECPKIGEIH